MAVTVRGPLPRGLAENGSEDLNIYRDSHPAIITRVQFEQVQAKRIVTAWNGYGQSYRSGRGAISPYLLSGLLFRRHCSHQWKGFNTSGAGGARTAATLRSSTTPPVGTSRKVNRSVAVVSSPRTNWRNSLWRRSGRCRQNTLPAIISKCF